MAHERTIVMAIIISNDNTHIIQNMVQRIIINIKDKNIQKSIIIKVKDKALTEDSIEILTLPPMLRLLVMRTILINTLFKLTKIIKIPPTLL